MSVIIRVKVNGTVTEAVSSPALSILNALVREGVRIRHDCGGKALCGTCRIRSAATAGGQAGGQAGGRAVAEPGPIPGLSPVGERERIRLEAVGAAPGERLACQAHASRDVEIEMVNPV